MNVPSFNHYAVDGYALKQVDVVITRGGVSVGETDFIKEAVTELAKSYFGS